MPADSNYLSGLVQSGTIHESWEGPLVPVAGNLSAMGEFLRTEHSHGYTTFPSGPRVLRAFQCDFNAVKVLIVGQDPYPTPGHAIGLSFAVEREVRPLPRSLQNIYAELRNDVGLVTPPHGDLSAWNDAGVLLLNRALSVRAGASASHRGKGWEPITEQAIRALAGRGTPLVAVLWGADARAAKEFLVGYPALTSAHPSPLSAANGFFGSKPFSRANAALVSQGADPVNWDLGA